MASSNRLEELIASVNPAEQDQLFENVINLANLIAKLARHVKITLKTTPDPSVHCDCTYLMACKVLCNQAENFIKMGHEEKILKMFVAQKMQHQSDEEIYDFCECVKSLYRELCIISPIYEKLKASAKISLHDILLQFVNLTLPMLIPRNEP